MTLIIGTLEEPLKSEFCDNMFRFSFLIQVKLLAKYFYLNILRKIHDKLDQEI